MKHADALIERILYLEGLPNVQRLGKINVGQTVPEQLRLDLEIERAAIRRSTRPSSCAAASATTAAAICSRTSSRRGRHANWLEAQLTLIEQVGEANYLAQQISEGGSPQPMLEPGATAWSGCSRITSPASSYAPSTSTSETNGPICLGGKLTTATTRRPTSSAAGSGA